MCSWSLGIQFDHLNYVLSNSILLIPMSSRVLKLSTKRVRIIWNHSLGCWKKSFYLHIYIFLNFRFKIIYPLIVFFFLREQIPKNKDILPLKTCVFFHFFCHYFPLYVSFLSFLLNPSIHYSSLFYVFNLSLFLTKNKRATTVHSLETKKMN